MASLKELEIALVNADKAGDMNAARKLAAVILRARQDITNQIPGTQVAETVEPTQQTTIGEDIVGAGEAALTVATGAVGGTAGMIGGALKGLAEQILSGQFGTPEAVRAVEEAAARGGEALTYAPRTQAGQEQVGAIGEALQGVPAVLPVVGPIGAVSAATRAAAPIVSATASRAAAPVMQGAERVGQAISRAAETARQFIPGAETTPRDGASGGRSVGAAATPEILRRVETAEGLPVPIKLTRGAASREAQQLEFEKKQIQTDLGGPLRSRAEENNLGALQNFDALIDMTDAQLADLSTTGGAVVKSLTEGLSSAKNKTRAAYKAAEQAGELEDSVTLNSVVDYINENIPEGDLAPILKAARQKAIAIGAAVPDESGNLVAQPVSLRQAESLRQTFQRAGYEGADQFHGGSLKRAFDAGTEGLGGDLYKKARATRAEQARKYENRAIVARLIKNRKNMADPVVAADQVFNKSVLNSSPEEITFLKRVLVTSGDDGKQAWNELQGATVRHLRDEATKGLGMDANDRPIVSPAKLNQTVNALDKNGRLDIMLGKKNAQIVRDLNDVVRYVTTVPPGTLVNTSGTAGTLLAAMAEAGATGALTGLPLPLATGIKQIVKMRKEGKTKARINDALNALPIANP
jgi:hypothetical protein